MLFVSGTMTTWFPVKVPRTIIHATISGGAEGEFGETVGEGVGGGVG